jgi:hypothetical protein
MTGVAALVVTGALLAGCGSASPGVAVQVGDEEITTNQVDELASEYCRAISQQLAAQNPPQVVPNRYFRGGIAGTLTMRAIGEQLGEEYDVEPGKTYDESVAKLEQSVSVLDEEVQEAVIEVESSPAYVKAMQAAVGGALLEEELGYAADYSEQVERGQQAFEDWVSANEVTFDPGLGITFENGEITDKDTSLSLAVGDSAVSGSAADPDPAYAATLPAAQSCR